MSMQVVDVRRVKKIFSGKCPGARPVRCARSNRSCARRMGRVVCFLRAVWRSELVISSAGVRVEAGKRRD